MMPVRSGSVRHRQACDKKRITNSTNNKNNKSNQFLIKAMKKLFLILAAVGVMSFSAVNVHAQEATETPAPEATEQVEEAVAEDVTEDTAYIEETQVEGTPMHQAIKQKFLEGGAGWMTPVLLCLVFGLAVAIERLLYLNLASINTKKFIAEIEAALNKGGVEAAMEIARNQRGPVASIYYQGLSRYGEGLDVVEKSVASYGSVQMGLMEKGLSWISLFISLSPMLGFMGTVVGMVAAFDAIQAAGDVSATLVAGGIKVALLTTLAGLIAAVILQLFYNYIVAKIDSLVINMEDSSIILVDMLTEYNKK